ncbi:MAG TPA: DeoR/GlpR family DNA-binding transcription regulator [Ktedonobacteraceae bacterium]|nr:DeoR/GlpR family DNA-binding transcription regulator [Ktedonobacteraceae bacterium]
MLASERRRLILERVAELQAIEAQALADELDVSVMTIRRDIKRLEQDGFLRQTYGGATVHITKSVELGFNSRALQYAAQKRLIGASAAQMIKPGQTLFLGEGTTTSQFAQFLPPHPHLQVITASLSHASLLGSRGIRVIVLGGKLHGDELTMTGPIAETTLARFYADVCILGAAGVDPQVGVTELDYEIASLHRLMMERSRRVIVLADHSKLGFRSPAVVAPASMVTTLVTDEAASAEILDQLRACGMQVTIAGKHRTEREEQSGIQPETVK